MNQQALKWFHAAGQEEVLGSTAVTAREAFSVWRLHDLLYGFSLILLPPVVQKHVHVRWVSDVVALFICLRVCCWEAPIKLEMMEEIKKTDGWIDGTVLVNSDGTGASSFIFVSNH